MHLLLVAYCFYLILVSNSFLAPSSKHLLLVAYCFYLILVPNSFLASSSKGLVTSSLLLLSNSCF